MTKQEIRESDIVEMIAASEKIGASTVRSVLENQDLAIVRLIEAHWNEGRFGNPNPKKSITGAVFGFKYRVSLDKNGDPKLKISSPGMKQMFG